MNENDSQPDAEASGAAQSDGAPTQRLVIRVKIIPEEPSLVAARGTLDKRKLAITLAAGLLAALTLLWILTRVFKEEASPPASSSDASSATPQSEFSTAAVPPNESARAFNPEPSSDLDESQSGSRRTSPDEPTSREMTAAEAQRQTQPNAPPSAIDEVLPNVPQSALQTIRGTVRVAIRVTVDNEGRVTNASSEIPGPSRYFERLSLEAAKKWTFTPAQAHAERMMLVRFYYRREGITARTERPQENEG